MARGSLAPVTPLCVPVLAVFSFRAGLFVRGMNLGHGKVSCAAQNKPRITRFSCRWVTESGRASHSKTQRGRREVRYYDTVAVILVGHHLSAVGIRTRLPVRGAKIVHLVVFTPYKRLLSRDDIWWEEKMVHRALFVPSNWR